MIGSLGPSPPSAGASGPTFGWAAGPTPPAPALPGPSLTFPRDTSFWTFGTDDLFQALYFNGARLDPVLVADTRRGQLRRWPLREALEPGSSYPATDDPCEPGACPLFTFTVGDGPATIPAIPTVTTAFWKEDDGGSCSESAFYEVFFDSPPNTIVLVALGRPTSSPPTLPSEADIVSLPTFAPSGMRAPVSVGVMSCGGTNWDFDTDDVVPLHVGALDPAGGFSGWSERLTLEAPACQSGVAPSAGLGAALLVLIVRRRRTCRARPA